MDPDPFELICVMGLPENQALYRQLTGRIMGITLQSLHCDLSSLRIVDEERGWNLTVTIKPVGGCGVCGDMKARLMSTGVTTPTLPVAPTCSRLPPTLKL
jgi:hypothetical protein